MSTQPIATLFSYIIDANNLVTMVSKEWLRFAQENSATHLTQNSILGKPLFDFIADAETRHLYQMVINKVRRSGVSLTVPFRCDAPALRRFMQLVITPLQNQHLQFVGEILREEPRVPVLLLDNHSARSDQFLTICSWCKRVKVLDNWLEVETAVSELGLFNDTLLPRLTHGMCQNCKESILSRAGLD